MTAMDLVVVNRSPLLLVVDHSSKMRWDDDVAINFPYVETCTSEMRSIMYSFRSWSLT